MELACGTGALAVEFAKAGFDVTGLDLSEEMLMIASQRAEQEDTPIQLVEGDMLDLTDVGTYEAITCYSDSICYMEDEQSVQQVFDGVYNSLRDDGVFMFDVHSTYQIDEVFLITATTIKQMSLPFSGKVTKEKFLTALNIFDFLCKMRMELSNEWMNYTENAPIRLKVISGC